jgi:hypothetical protein
LPQFAAGVMDSVELSGDLVTFRVRAKAGDAACSGLPQAVVAGSRAL